MGEHILGLITLKVEKPVKNPLQKKKKKSTAKWRVKEKDLKCGNGAKMRETELEDIKGTELTGLCDQIECRSWVKFRNLG